MYFVRLAQGWLEYPATSAVEIEARFRVFVAKVEQA
jgi:hypothetical protein